MDISTYISQLLFEHDCVIIPGLGGFVCNYQPAEIHPIHHTLAPPSKAISFNRNLKSNDGLLVSHIAKVAQVSFDKATDVVSTWVNSSNLLLKKNEEITISKVGKLFNDIERNLQFTPDTSVNYLKASFGLPTITAEPILRGKVIEFTEKFTKETKHTVGTRSMGRVAAILLLFVAMLGLAEMMWMGIEVKQLNLDEANVFGFLNRLTHEQDPEVKPLPIEIENTNAVVVDTDVTSAVIDSSALVENVTEPVTNEDLLRHAEGRVPPPPKEDKQPGAVARDISPVVSETGGEHTYYVMIGAFAEEKNVEAARARLQQRFPDSVIIIEKGRTLTKLGYSVGHRFYPAIEQLKAAQVEDSAFWLLKK